MAEKDLDLSFNFERRKGDRVAVSHRGKVVKTLRSAEASKFLTEVESLDRNERQLLMARVTGNFKRGNERRS